MVQPRTARLRLPADTPVGSNEPNICETARRTDMMRDMSSFQRRKMAAYFEPIARDDNCPYCSGRRTASPLPAPLDAVYCISLQEQPHRTQLVSEHFHKIGLCRHVTFYRPVRGKGSIGIWTSHRALAQHAVARGCRSALFLEDDVVFRRDWDVVAPRVGRALAALPETWWGFYLGHVPWQAYFVRPNILRVRSTCTHAYIANARLLAWLAATAPLDAAVPIWQRCKGSLDGAISGFPGMYALFPMVVVQRFLGDQRVSPHLDDKGRPRRWNDPERWRYFFIFHGALALQAIAVALSPFHRLTLEHYRRRVETQHNRDARLIRDTGFRDDGYYRSLRPDVAVLGIDPLGHYLEHGAAEGCRPLLLFDPAYYAAQSPDLGQDNPFAHFVRVGAALKRNPHPLFDTGFYLAHYAERIPQGINPLAHFLAAGGLDGCDPHPLFASAWYLAQHPEVRERGQNPLVHYLTEGWRAGYAPHPQFDGERYLQSYPDLKAADVNPLEHYVLHGRAEGRAQPIPASTPQPAPI